MTTFAQSALGMLRSAESALAGEDVPYKARFSDGGEVPVSRAYPTGFAAAAVPSPESQSVLLLAQQLQQVMKEMTVLKSELVAEREGRSEALTALGQRWREGLLVEVRSGDHALHREVAEVEERVAVHLKTEATTKAALQRQVELLTRGAKARDTTQFETLEGLRDEVDSLRKQVVEATTQCTSVRVETTRELELERAALSRRLDAELLRYVDMRQDDQREMQKVKGLVRDEVQRVAAQVRGMVDEAWQTCATALEKSVRDSLQQFERDARQNKQAVLDMQGTVSDCTRTVQAELRVQTGAFKERIAALESNEAVMTSRVDRAEKKSDAAHDTVSRLSAELQSQKETVDRCAVGAQRAADLARAVESTQLDRDARLQKVEQHLQATTTAEMLRAEVESCKRAVGRVESRMDAVSVVCHRAEEAAERSSRGVESAVDRAAQSEKAVNKVTAAAQELNERVRQCAQRVSEVEGTRDAMASAAERHDLASARLDQRLTTAENRLRLMGERHDQVTQDLTRTQEAHGARIEAAHEVAARSDAASALAKAEVNRLEKRLLRVEAGITTFTAECASIHADVQDSTKDLAGITAEHRHLRERLEASEARFAERAQQLEELSGLEGTLSDAVGKVEARVERQLTSLADHTKERLGQVEAQLRELAGKGDIERRITHRVSEWQGKVKDFVTDQYRSLKHRCEDIERAVQEQQSKVTSLEESAAANRALAEELQGMRQAVAGLETTTQQRTAQCTQSINTTRDTVRAVQDELVVAQEDLGHTRQALHKVEHDLEANQKQLEQLRRDVEAAHQEQEAATRRALSTAENVAQRLALSLEKPLTAPSTSSTMMAGNNSADASSPSAHLSSGHATAAPAKTVASTSATQSHQQQQQQQQAMPPLSAHGSLGSTATSSSSPARQEGSADLQRVQSHISSISSVHPPSDQQALRSSAGSSAHAHLSYAEAAVSAPAPLPAANLSAFNSSGQRTVIQRFNALDDSTTEESAVSSHARRHLGDDETEDVTTTDTTPSPARRPAPASAGVARDAPLNPASADADAEEEEEEEYYEEEDEEESAAGAAPARHDQQQQQQQRPGTEEDGSSATGPLHTSSQPVTRPSNLGHNDWDDDDDASVEEDEEEIGSTTQNAPVGSSQPTTGGLMHGGDDDSDDSDDSDLVLPMSGATRAGVKHAVGQSPSPARPAASPSGRGGAGGGGGAEALHATPRKAFVHSSDDDDDPLRHEEVPTHGKSTTTTSSSSGERASASPKSGDATPGRGAVASTPAGAARPTGTRYTTFDDSDDDEDA